MHRSPAHSSLSARRSAAAITFAGLAAAALVGCKTGSAASASGPTTTTPVPAADGSLAGGSPVPADISVSSRQAVKDGQELKIVVKAVGDTQIFGFEAFLCNGRETFVRDADIRPTLTGKCLPDPVSSGSDAYKEVPSAPPYQAVEATFRAGIGKKSFTLRDGTQTTIACGHDNPCALVLKVQFPNGYGFRTYPLGYS